MATIRERNGTYQITVYSGFDLNGRRKRETTTFTPPKELSPKKKEKVVQAFAIEFENRVKNGLVLAGEKTTLREFVDRWRKEYASQNLEPGTLEKYNAEIDDKILPMLGHMILTEIKPHNVNGFYVSMTKSGVRRDGKPGGYSKGTITKTANVLSSILKTAVDWEVINRNPCDKVRTHGEDVADKIKFFTPAQVSCFLEYIEKPYEIHTRGHSRVDDTGIQYQVGDYTLTRTMPEQLRVLFNLAVFSGLRKGEMLALQWSDIDFENSTVSVTKAAAVVDGKQVCKAPKTKNSRREVSIPRFLTDRLHSMMVEQTKTKESLGAYWKGNNWLFTQSDGSMMSYSTPYATFQDAIDRYNANKEPSDQLPHIPFHGLRHPYVKHTTKIFSLRSMAFQAQAYPDARRKTRGACQLRRGGQSQSPVHPLCNRKRFSYLPPQSKISRILYAISMRLSGYTSTRSISSSASSVVSASASKIALDASFRLSCRACSSCFCFACANTAA